MAGLRVVRHVQDRPRGDMETSPKALHGRMPLRGAAARR
eukprot:CAMPEP_0172545778 /NCGR_PEP_ID=MMETSP1067-20121228/15647_1 /TAXON_ID=265564 ORGANISM="Thalassiosira punctigera, Strain Tpunct2005C2" /NCGR_SAMPLE_ID=MMETSP1067 /ASSEMBLY_ACC=CAM_ASM_000444 /LENGTH=38 /DNA_ID= /DNA_START= /DNA_END= /DNA_ORIENTATION=